MIANVFTSLKQQIAYFFYKIDKTNWRLKESMKVRFSCWSNPIGNSHYFCKPHTGNVAFNGIHLSDCLASFTFDATQLGMIIAFIIHTRNLRSLGGIIYMSNGFDFRNKSTGNSYDRGNMFFQNDKTFNFYLNNSKHLWTCCQNLENERVYNKCTKSQFYVGSISRPMFC